MSFSLQGSSRFLRNGFPQWGANGVVDTIFLSALCCHHVLEYSDTWPPFQICKVIWMPSWLFAYICWTACKIAVSITIFLHSISVGLVPNWWVLASHCVQWSVETYLDSSFQWMWSLHPCLANKSQQNFWGEIITHNVSYILPHRCHTDGWQRSQINESKYLQKWIKLGETGGILARDGLATCLLQLVHNLASLCAAVFGWTWPDPFPDCTHTHEGELENPQSPSAASFDPAGECRGHNLNSGSSDEIRLFITVLSRKDLPQVWANEVEMGGWRDVFSQFPW